MYCNPASITNFYFRIKKEPKIYDDNTIVYDENSELTHKCSLCDKAFLHKYNIKRHMKLVHDGVKPFDCEYCGKSFGTKEILNRHIKKVHENDNKNCKRKKKKVKIKMKKQDFADSQISIENCDSNIHDAILGNVNIILEFSMPIEISESPICNQFEI